MSEQLTQREINWIEGWIDALDADTYAAGILRKLVAAARGAHDAEQRAKQAEGKVEQIRTNVNNQVLTIRKYREQRDEARQEAARLRQSLQAVVDDMKRVWNLTGEDLIAIKESAESTLQSAPPASERVDLGAVLDERGEVRRDPAPADRPEPSEALKEAQGALFRLKCRAERGEDRLLHGDLGASEEDAAIIRPYLSQPAPAVPEQIGRLVNYVDDVATDIHLMGKAEARGQLREIARQMRQAMVAAAPTPTDGER